MSIKTSPLLRRLAGGIVAIGLGGLLVFWLGDSQGLSHQGKPLHYWFNQLPMTKLDGRGGRETVSQCTRLRTRHTSGAVREYGNWNEDLEVTLKAIRSIGTNGIKLYLSKLRQPDRPLKDKIQKKAFAVGLQRFLFADVTAEREQAVTALILLKPLPPTAIQDLLVLSANSNPGISNAARCVLTTEVKKLPIMEPTLRPHFDWTPTPDSNFP